MAIQERRKYPRIKLITKVAHIREDKFHYFYSRDLSAGGIFLETDHPYPVGTELELEFPLPEVSERIRIKGKVVRVVETSEQYKGKTPGMGIQFEEMDSETSALLADFIARELARQ